MRKGASPKFNSSREKGGLTYSGSSRSGLCCTAGWPGFSPPFAPATHFKGGIMTEPAHKAKTKEYRENFDKIFKKKKCKDCDCRKDKKDE